MEGIALAALAVLAIVVVAWAYNAGHLNWMLPASMQKKSMFIGAMGRAPAMQHCLAYEKNHGRRQSRFNRCMWV